MAAARARAQVARDLFKLLGDAGLLPSTARAWTFVRDAPAFTQALVEVCSEADAWGTVYWYFARWRKDGSLDRLHDALRDQLRRAEGREEQPTAAIIDAQSVKDATTVGAATRGFDAPG